MNKQSVIVIITCPNCESIVGFVSPDWKLGKRHAVMCAVCQEKFYVALTIKPVSEAKETPVPKTFIKAEDNW